MAVTALVELKGRQGLLAPLDLLVHQDCEEIVDYLVLVDLMVQMVNKDKMVKLGLMGLKVLLDKEVTLATLVP